MKAGLTQTLLSVAMDISSKFVGHVESAKSNAKYYINHLNTLPIISVCSIKDFFPDKPLISDSPEPEN